MKYKLWCWRFKIRMMLRVLTDPAVEGFWLTVGDVLWMFPGWRDRYYAYREGCWRKAQTAKPFGKWLRDGGWRGK